MSYHRFAVLTEQGESGVNSEEYQALFAPDVTLYSPYLIKPLSDKDLTVQFLTKVFALSGYPKYTHQFTDDQQTTLFLWEGKLQGPDGRIFTLEGSLAITEGEDGLIHTIISYLRPLQVGILILRDPMMPFAGSLLPKEYWDPSPQPLAAM